MIMIITINQAWYIYHIYHGNEMSLEYVGKWSKWLLKIKNRKISTIKTYVKSLELYWIWSLYKMKRSEFNDLIDQLADYRALLKTGFKITDTVINKLTRVEITITHAVSKPKASITINKELQGIQSYYKFIDLKQVKLYSDKLNDKYYRITNKKGMGDGW